MLFSISTIATRSKYQAMRCFIIAYIFNKGKTDCVRERQYTIRFAFFALRHNLFIIKTIEFLKKIC